VLAKRKFLVLGLPIVATVIALVMVLQMPKIYTASARISPPQQSQSRAAAALGPLTGMAGAAGRSGLQVNDYLSLAGGPRKQADERSIYLLKANGPVTSSRQSAILTSSLAGRRIMPGDTIVVPEDFQRTTWTKAIRDWPQISCQFGRGAAALQVIKD
jgi:hypothetical protein